MSKITIKFSNPEYLEPYALNLPFLRRITKTYIVKKLEASLIKARAIKKSQSETIYINFVSLSEIKKMNFSYRKKDSATDVLSFPAEQGLSEIYICPEFVEKNAQRFKVSLEEELLRVVVHGILHILGYNHERSFSIKDSPATENSEKRNKGKLEKMFVLQEKIINYFYTV